MLELVAGSALALLLLALIVKLISLPLKLVWKIVVNSIIGMVLLATLKFLGFEALDINIISVLAAGFGGIPGVIAVLVYYYIL